MEAYISIFERLIKAWRTGGKTVRFFIGLAVILFLSATVVFAFARIDERSAFLTPLQAIWTKLLFEILSLAALFILACIAGIQSISEREAKEQQIKVVEEKVRDHPEKPQLAWDLARNKLESYLDRNLGQVRSIYWLTLFVMMVGFSFILYGLYQAFQTPDKLSASVVASASGVLISFIGGSFLLIYRSILAQSKDYVTVLERINAVGMAVQVISNIPEASADLKHKTTAELAKQLLDLYSNRPIAREKITAQ